MKTVLLALFALVTLLPLTACEDRSAAYGFCLGEDGTYQDCSICCEVDQAQECCDRAEALSSAVGR